MPSHKKSAKRALSDYVCIILGSAILSFGVYNVHGQSSITEGGVLGLVLFFRHWFHLPASITNFLLDAILYAIGFRYLGKQFLKYSIVGSCTASLFYRIYERFPPVLPSLAEYPLTAAIIGALFVGVGAGLVVRAGAASGGDDALALLLSNKLRWPIARAYLFSDLTILLVSLTYIPYQRILYSLVTVTISSIVIGQICEIGQPAESKEEKTVPISAATKNSPVR